jgi:hypothetical protein
MIMMFSSAMNSGNVIVAPYPHIALPDALTRYRELAADFPSEERFSVPIRMHGDLTDPDPEYARLLKESSAWRALHDTVYSEDFITGFMEVFRTEIETRMATGELLVNPFELPMHVEPFEGRQLIGRTTEFDQSVGAFIFPRLDIGIGRSGYGRVNGGRGVHVDNSTRLISILIYLGENLSMVGGEHRLFRLEGHRPVVDKCYPPAANFMVASLQSNMAYHDVNPVTDIEGVRKAIYMAVSCSAPLWAPHRNRRLQRLTKNRYQPNIIERSIARVRRAAKP